MAYNLAAALANSYKTDRSISDANRRATISRLEQLHNNIAQDLYGANNFNQLFDPNFQKTLGMFGTSGGLGNALNRVIYDQGRGNWANIPTSNNNEGGRFYYDANTGRWMTGKARFDNNTFSGYDYTENNDFESQFVKDLVTRLSDPYVVYTNTGETSRGANALEKLVEDSILSSVGGNANLAKQYFGFDPKEYVVQNPFSSISDDWSKLPGILGDLYARGGYATDNTKGIDALYQPFVSQNVTGILGNGNHSLFKLGNVYRDMFSSMGFTDRALDDVTNKSIDAARYGLGIDRSRDLSAQWNMLSNTLKGTPGGGGLTDFSRWLQNYNTGTTNTGTTTGTTDVYTTGTGNGTTGNTGTGTTGTTTGTTNTGGVTNNTYQMYPAATSRQDMNRGSRYFDTTTGAYNNMYPSLGNWFQQGQGQGSF